MRNQQSTQSVIYLLLSAAFCAVPAVGFAACPVTPNAVTFLGADTTTQGAWKGAGNFNAPPASSSLTYGTEGVILPDTEGCDLGCNPVPSYASFGPQCINSATPGNTGSKPNSTHAYVNLVQGPAGVMGAEPQNTSNTNYFQCNYTDNNPAVPWAPMVGWRPVVDTREISRWYTCSGISSFYLELSFGNSTHNFEVYVVDDMNGGTLARTEELQVLDGDTGAVLWDSGVFTNFSAGIYYKWAITGHVKIKVINKATNGRDAVINGVFFDPQYAAPLPVSISVWPPNSSVAAGFSEQMIATVSNTPNTAVTWSISPPVGSISAGGVYTAPANVSSVQTVSVKATSAADMTKSASATLTLLPPVTSVSGGPLVASIALGTLRNNYDGWVGFGFRVGPSPLTVYGLGRIAVAGNTQAHTVKLVDANTGADVPGGSASIAPGAATPGTFAYASLVTPVTLSASNTYYVLTQETYGGDQWYDNNMSLQTSADATGTGPIYGTGSWRSGGPAGHSYGPVDVKYTLSGSPPPVQVTVTPGSASLSASGTQPFTATVTGSSNTGVTWSLNPNVGTVSAAGLYTAPASIATGQVVTVTAASSADPTKSGSATVSLQAASSGASAQFVRTDTTTQGNWKSAYGGDGFVLVNDGNQPPAYASITPSGASSWTWAASTTDTRGLQKAGVNDRLAATWYSDAPTFSVDLNLSAGTAHQVAFYCLDFDGLGRGQTVDILDAQSGTVLNSQSLSGFNGGAYLVWTISGHVTVRFTQTAGKNAVTSGVFFGGPGVPTSNAAQFVKVDTSTSGSWKGHYGATAANVIGDTAVWPSYTPLVVSGQSFWTWASPTSDLRAPLTNAGSNRVAATWYSGTIFNVDVRLTDGKAHTFSIYCVDWENAGRSQTVDVLDGDSGALLDTRTLSAFDNGQYLVWNISGHVNLRFTSTGAKNAVVSALFLE